MTTHKREKLTALLHHIPVGCLRWSYFELKKTAATGVDGVTGKDWKRTLQICTVELSPEAPHFMTSIKSQTNSLQGTMAKIHDIQEEGELVELPEEEEVEVEDVDLCGKPQPTRKKMRMYSGRYKSTEKEWKRCFFSF